MSRLTIIPESLAEVIEEQWYGVLETRAVGRRPVKVRRFGVDLVLWRDRGGAIVCQRAACPHRGADLSLGRVVAGELECPYHGFRFAGDGRCVATPCEPGGRPPRRGLDVATYACREAHGIVWVFWGRSAPKDELPWFIEIPRTLAYSATRTAEWNAGFSRVMENMLDMHHFPFAHRRWNPGWGTVLDPYEASSSGDVIRTAGTLRPDGQASGKTMQLELSVHFPGVAMGRRGKATAVIVATPIDDERTWILTRYYQELVRLPLVGRWLAALGLWLEGKLTAPEDERMTCSSFPLRSDGRCNQLLHADKGLALWHKRRDAQRGLTVAVPPATRDVEGA